MWWGYSPSFDIREEVEKYNILCSEPCSINILLVGCSDMRHVLHTVASSYKYEPRRLNFSIYDPTPELVARQALFLASVLDDSLSGINKSRTFLEIFGNALLRQDTYSYLIGLSKRLSSLISDYRKASHFLPSIDFSFLRYRDRDALETIFRFWAGGAGRLYKARKVDMTGYWDERLRHFLGVRYDNAKGVIDWDFQMRLHQFARERIRWDEYYRWRKNGVAFAWMESEPTRVNPTLVSGITTFGDTLEHLGYMGDILNPPLFSYGMICADQEMHRTMNGRRMYDATALSERNITRFIHEILTGTPYTPPPPRENETIVITELSAGCAMPEEQDDRNKNREFDLNRLFLKPENVSDFQVNFLPIVPLDEFIHDPARKFQGAYDVVVLGQGFSEDPPETLIKMTRPRGGIFVESKRFILGNKKEDLKSWSNKVNEGFTKWKCVEASSFSAYEENYAKFILKTEFPSFTNLRENENQSETSKEENSEELPLEEEFKKMREKLEIKIKGDNQEPTMDHHGQGDSGNFIEVKDSSNILNIIEERNLSENEEEKLSKEMKSKIMEMVEKNSENLNDDQLLECKDDENVLEMSDIQMIKSQIEQMMTNKKLLKKPKKKTSVVIEEVSD